MAKHVGIVACSAEGAALCYRTLCTEAEAFMGEHRHPEVSLHTFSLADYMVLINADNWSGVGGLMADSAAKLASIGADFAICPDNTIHQAYDAAREDSPIPWLHIAECVAEAAAAQSVRKLGITGTAYLMTGPVYPSALDRAGIEHALPTVAQRVRINGVIFDELVKGVVTEESQAFFLEVFAELKQAGCDAVVMGCTEIPLLMEGVETPVPALDSTRILARAALRHALA
ncbi:MAG: amino acid racemase [Pseudomonadota bacterium]